MRQTNPAHHLLLYSPGAPSGFYVFKWLEKIKNKKSFETGENYRRFKVRCLRRKFYWSTTTCFHWHLWLLLPHHTSTGCTDTAYGISSLCTTTHSDAAVTGQCFRRRLSRNLCERFSKTKQGKISPQISANKPAFANEFDDSEYCNF